MALRFAGQEGSISLINSSTGEALLGDMHCERFSFSVLVEMTTKRYLGQIGPQIREFYDGYELTIDYDPNSPVQLVEFVNLAIAKSQGKIVDEFACAGKFVAPDVGGFRVVFRDIHWDTQAFNLQGQHEFLGKNLKGRGNALKFERT